MPNPELKNLIEKLDVQGDRAAEKIIAKLCKLGSTAVPFLLVAAKDESNRRIQKWSLQALGGIGDKRSGGVLIASLSDERMTVKLHALRGLKKMKLKKAVPSITRLLDDPSGGIRVNALYALMAIGASSALPAIRRLLQDPQWYVRQNACVACAQFKDSKVRSRLKILSTNDERKAVRTAALEALTKLK